MMEADWYYLTSIDLKCDTFQILALISLMKFLIAVNIVMYSKFNPYKNKS